MKYARTDYDRIIDPTGKIGEDEPVFLIRGTDSLAPIIIEAWAEEAEDAGCDDSFVQQAYRWANHVREWQRDNPDKVHLPDMPKGVAAEF